MAENILKRNGPDGRRKTVPTEQVRNDYLAGMRVVDIAAKYGLGIGTVRAILEGKHWSQRDS